MTAAADVIAERAGYMWPSLDPNLRDAIATVALDALADAGYAVVELQEPDYHDAATGEPVWGMSAYKLPEGPERLRAQAAALIAAANHAEGEQ